MNENTDRERQLAEGPSFAWPVAVLSVCAALLVNPHPDPDLWGHVQYGRDVFAYGFPWISTYTYTAENYPWINHENLAELFFALGTDNLGVPFLLIAKCVAGVAMMGMLLSHIRRNGCAWLPAATLTILVGVNMTGYWTLRPQIFSFLGFACLLEILSRAWPRDRTHETELQRRRSDELSNEGRRSLDSAGLFRFKPLFFLPLLFICWANSHGGFLAGVFTLIAYLGVRVAEIALSRKPFKFRASAILIGIGLLSVASTLATPYGIKLLVKLYYKLSVPRPEVSEWHPPQWDNPVHSPFFLLIAVAVVSLLFTKRRREAAPVVVLIAILWQSLTHARHIPFFALTVGWFIAPHWGSSYLRIASWLASKRTTTDVPNPILVSRTFALQIVVTLAAVIFLGWKVIPQLKEMPVDRAEYPVSAVQFLQQHKLLGKMVVTFDWSQYIIAAFGSRDPNRPGMTVQFDGRFRTCYPQEMLDLHFDLLLGDGDKKTRYRSPNSPSCDPSRVLNYLAPDLVLIDRKLGHAVRVMHQNENQWTLLYQDSLAQLWGRSSRYADEMSPDFLPVEKRQISNQLQTGTTPWPAMPQP